MENLENINEHIFQELIGAKHNGRVRGFGLGPTPRNYFGSTSYDIGARWSGNMNSSQNAEVVKLRA